MFQITSDVDPSSTLCSPFMLSCWREKRRQLNFHKLAKTHWKLLAKLQYSISSVLEMGTINYDLKLEYEARMLQNEASKKRARTRTFNPQLADCSIGDKRRGDPKSRSAMEIEERERRENEKRRVCVSGPGEEGFISRRRGPEALFPPCVSV